MSKWDGKSKGTPLGYKFFMMIIKLLPLRFVYLVLRLVTYYYYVFAKNQREGIVKFYSHALNYSKKEAQKLTRTNFYIFGQTLVDRIAFLIEKGSQFTFNFNNEKVLHQIKNDGKGGILLSGHVGNWETAGNLLKDRITSNINVLMYDEEAQKLKKVLESQTGGSKFNIIPIKNDLTHVIKVHNVLKNNELVAIHADRYLEGAKFLELDFLGRKAKFPLGPFIIASKFNAPVTFVFAWKDGEFHYELSATDPITGKHTPKEIALKFVEELEKKVTLHPEQWFNYFDFYK